MDFLLYLLPILLFLLSGIRIIQEYQRSVIFRLGRYVGMRGPGLILLIPMLERQKVIDIRTQTVDVERQETMTRDNVTIKINAVLWYQIREPDKSILKVSNIEQAVYQVALTSMRNVIGQHELDEVLKERDIINRKVKKIVDEVTDPWGILVNLVEMKDVEIPISMQRAMAQEAEAVREKRARLIKAEGELDASQKLSEGAKHISENPMALELRRMQMLAEIGSENNSTTIILLPSEFSDLARKLPEVLQSTPIQKK